MAAPIASPQLSPLEVLEKVDAFYKTSWEHLLAYTAGLCIFIGILIPLAMQFIQWMTFRSRERREREQLGEKLKDIDVTLDAKVTEAITKLEAKQTAKIKSLEDELKAQIDFAHSFNFFLQGVRHLPATPKLALKNFITAAEYLVGAPNERELQVALNRIADDCLTKMDKASLTPLPSGYNPETEIEGLIVKLKKEYPNGRYSLHISKIRQALENAKNRTQSKP